MTEPAEESRPGSEVASDGELGPWHGAVPRTNDIAHPRSRMMTSLRPPFQAAVRRLWDVEVIGADAFPADGPVVVVGNHVGFLDGPLMAIMGPRPVHALTKRELFVGPLGTFLRGAGQIPLDRYDYDPRAIRTSIRVLRDGGAVGVFPEGNRGTGDLIELRGGAAYLAMTTGAVVQPVIYLGTRLPGGSSNSVPPRGTRMCIMYGEPFAFEPRPWPRRRPEVAAATERIGEALRATLARAQSHTGMSLPGPIPLKEPRHD